MPFILINTLFFKWDYQLFEWINSGWSSNLLDLVMPWLREPLFWLPLYVFIIGFVVFNFGKKSYWFLIFTVLTIGTSDMVSSRIIKNTIERPRPCHYQSSTHTLKVIKRVRCGSGYSFTSSHATNHFAIATFLIGVLGIFLTWLRPWMWLWAAMISLAQVYVGVHFPLDILVGGIIGTLIGWLYALLFLKFYSSTFGINTTPIV